MYDHTYMYDNTYTPIVLLPWRWGCLQEERMRREEGDGRKEGRKEGKGEGGRERREEGKNAGKLNHMFPSSKFL